MTNKIILWIIILSSGYFMLTTFSPVLFEETIDEGQRAYEKIEHKVFDHSEDTILLNTNDVRMVMEKTKTHYLEQWRVKGSHLLMSFLTLCLSAVLMFKELKNKNKEI